jgi:hypothetical protein
MTRNLDAPTKNALGSGWTHADKSKDGERPIYAFTSELERMTPRSESELLVTDESSRALDLPARYPEEVPTVNGELEWIALNMA